MKIALDVNDASYHLSGVGKKAIMEVTIINDDGKELICHIQMIFIELKFVMLIIIHLSHFMSV